MNKELTVAVVGAGPAGLNALRVLNHNPDNAQTTFRATAFEQSSRIGGTWFYTDCVGTDELGLPVHSSMYKNLRTNLPKECMAFPDYPFPQHLPSYTTHKDVYKYLQDYATDFQLWEDIEFKTIVENVKPVHDENKPFGVKWEVTTADVTNREDKQTRMFDAVMVCNGHLTRPLIPQVSGLDLFEGHLMHSHSYREPKSYTEKTVVVLGAKNSGMDISCEVAEVASQVYLCHNQPKLETSLHPKIEQKPGIKRCSKRVVEFKDGSEVEADAIILCTGYMYDFPFLDDSVGIKVEDGRVTPLYKHLISVDYPSLGINGIVKTGPSFPLSHFQTVYFRSILDGSGTLPSRKEMLKDEEEDFNLSISRGFPARQAHLLLDTFFDYMKDLAELGHFDYLPAVFQEIHDTALQFRGANAVAYREINFVMSNDDTDFTVVHPE